MPVTNGYHLASLAQNKLDKEAHRSEHILRRLVGHANLLDTLLEELDLLSNESESELQPLDSRLSTFQQLKTETEIEVVIQSFEDESDDQSEDVEEESDCTEIDDEIDIQLVLVRSPPRRPVADSVKIVGTEDDLSVKGISILFAAVDAHTAAAINDKKSVGAEFEEAQQPPLRILQVLDLSPTELTQKEELAKTLPASCEEVTIPTEIKPDLDRDLTCLIAER